MKKLFTVFILLFSIYSYCQLTNGDLIREKYKNYDFVVNLPDVALQPPPNKNSSNELEGINKYTYTSKLKKQQLYNRIIQIFDSNIDLIKTEKVIFDDKQTLSIERQFEFPFSYYYGRELYNKVVSVNLKIRVKDNAYQIEIKNFAVGEPNNALKFNFRYIISEATKEFDKGAIGQYFKRLSQQEYNQSFIAFKKKFSELEEKINEENDF